MDRYLELLAELIMLPVTAYRAQKANTAERRASWKLTLAICLVCAVLRFEQRKGEAEAVGPEAGVLWLNSSVVVMSLIGIVPTVAGMPLDMPVHAAISVVSVALLFGPIKWLEAEYKTRIQ